MSLTNVPIHPTGGTLYAEVQFGTDQVIAYRLEVFDANSNTRVADATGNNQNPADDLYALPDPAGVNLNRIAMCSFVIIDPNGGGNAYAVEMAIHQRDLATGALTQIGAVKAAGTTNNTHVSEVIAAKFV